MIDKIDFYYSIGSRYSYLASTQKVKEYSRLLFAAIFQDSLSEIDETKCTSLAEACGIPAIDFQVALRAQETIDKLNTTIDNALCSGVFGVPAFVAMGELFWGNDRIILLRHYLDSCQGTT
ncbi:MAG: DsbA family protein [Thermosynechococcaceae cyanobacterium]